jgi:4-hydroxyphenylpyruvate dioxygenase
MRHAIATVSLQGTLDEKLTAIAAAGFDAIELFVGDLPEGRGAAREARKRAADLGLDILLFQPLRDFEGTDEARMGANFDRAEAMMDLVEDAGAPMLLVCSNTSDAAADDARAAAHLAALAERASLRGLRIGYEALAWGKQVSTYAHAYSLVELAAHPALGIILDSFHVLVRPEDWSGIGCLPGDRIFFVQVSDAPIVERDYMSWRREYSTLPGRGELDVSGFLRAVAATGYSGPLSVEIFNLRDRTPPDRMALDAAHSLRELERKILTR